MKKTILASAIAAATFSGAAMAQSTLSASELAAKMDSMPTVYGNIQYAITHTNVDGGGSEVEHFDNGTTLGVKHDHEIAPGITGFFKLELDGFGADEKDSDGANIDEAYIGIKGDSFGQIWVGSDDSIYETAVDEVAQFHEVGSDIGFNYDTGEGDLVQYLSPSFSGLTFGAAVQVNGDNNAKGGDKSFPYQLAAMYEVDALELAFAVDSNDNGNGNNENSYGLRASYNLDNLRLTGSFETRKDVADVLGLMGVYTLGKNQFALSYQLSDDDDSGDKNDTIILQALHNVSDHMYVYFEGYLSNADEDIYSIEDEPAAGAGDEQSIAAIGAVYYF
ncbi:porin [Marinobacter nauticus]|uniref:porin n=1 Tax=Marinobacter nauticus TaxID=2743 RepID=UPI001CFE0D94|nr:porin [Marinobacter nauticus]